MENFERDLDSTHGGGAQNSNSFLGLLNQRHAIEQERSEAHGTSDTRAI